MAESNLDRDIRRLISEAKTSEMTNSEIDKCIDEALEEFLNSKRGVCGKLYSLMLLGMKLCAGFLALLFICYLVILSNRDVQRAIMPYVVHRISDVTRAVRKITIPLGEPFDRFEWYKWHDDICVIDNPFKEIMTADCQSCDVDSVVMETDLNENTFVRDYHLKTIPLKTRNNKQQPVTFTQIKDNYELYANLSQMGDNWIESDSVSSANVTEFMRHMTEAEIEQTNDMHVVWHMKRAGPSAFIRKFFPTPIFLPSHSEIDLKQKMVIDSPRSRETKLLSHDTYSSLYMQGYGERELVLVPAQHCQHICKNLTVIMETGDLLYADTLQWSIVTKPVVSSDKTHPSIAVVIHVE